METTFKIGQVVARFKSKRHSVRSLVYQKIRQDRFCFNCEKKYPKGTVMLTLRRSQNYAERFCLECWTNNEVLKWNLGEL